MKEIKLSLGVTAKVDDGDYDFLMQWKWYALNGRGGLYAYRSLPRKSKPRKGIFMHRVIMEVSDEYKVDHINHDTLDNRRENLRICKQEQNLRNRIKKGDFSSIYKGVHKCGRRKEKWQATISFSKKHIYLGRYESEIDAACAYDVAAIKHFGEFALLNFPELWRA